MGIGRKENRWAHWAGDFRFKFPLLKEACSQASARYVRVEKIQTYLISIPASWKTTSFTRICSLPVTGLHQLYNRIAKIQKIFVFFFRDNSQSLKLRLQLRRSHRRSLLWFLRFTIHFILNCFHTWHVRVSLESTKVRTSFWGHEHTQENPNTRLFFFSRKNDLVRFHDNLKEASVSTMCDSQWMLVQLLDILQSYT